MTAQHVAAAAVFAALATSSCVSPARGDPAAFCAEVRRTAPALLEELEPADVGPDIRRAATTLIGHVPEALVDDVKVLASSDDRSELAQALEAVHGYASAACASRQRAAARVRPQSVGLRGISLAGGAHRGAITGGGDWIFVLAGD